MFWNIENILKKILISLGINISRPEKGLILIKSVKSFENAFKKYKSFSYELINARIKYSPWVDDEDFNKVYNIIRNKKYTLVDEKRCWELWDIINNVKVLNGDLIEVGAWRGGTAGLIAKKYSLIGGKNTIYICDTFEGVVKATKEDPFYFNGEHANTNVDMVEDLLKNKLALNNYKILKGIFPDETGSEIISNSFIFCHIDVDTYKSAEDIIDFIWDKMVKNSIIVYDDYAGWPTPGITRHVNKLVNERNCQFFYNLNGHAIIIKK